MECIPSIKGCDVWQCLVVNEESHVPFHSLIRAWVPYLHRWGVEANPLAYRTLHGLFIMRLNSEWINYNFYRRDEWCSWPRSVTLLGQGVYRIGLQSFFHSDWLGVVTRILLDSLDLSWSSSCSFQNSFVEIIRSGNETHQASSLRFLVGWKNVRIEYDVL